MTYYVYELFDPRDNAVFYVGKGTRSRIDQHEREARAGRISRKCERIRLIESLGLSVGKRKIATFDNEQEAFDHEADVIDQYGLACLTNVIPGGGTARGPTTYSDRVAVRYAAELINRSRNGRLDVLVAGKPLGLPAIIEEYKRRVFEVIDRRGYDWVNMIARRFSVEFAGG